MGDIVCRIEKLTNGYEVEIREPEMPEKPKKKGEPSIYVDPWRSFAFKDCAEVTAFLTKNLDKAKSGSDDYDSAFDAAVAADDKD